jgi:adenylosuccinate synthase
MSLIILSGHIAAGKTTLANGLSNYGYHVLKTRELLEEEVRIRTTTVSGKQLSMNRHELQKLGETLDEQSCGGRWVVPYVIEAPHTSIVLDSVRRIEQVEALRDDVRLDHIRIIHIHLEAAPEQLEIRYQRRGDSESYAEISQNTTESQVGGLRNVADFVLSTDRCAAPDTLTRVLSHLGLRRNTDARLVDVLIGAQYGSEGKGHVISHIAPEYDVQVRVGGANAGHTVLTRDGAYAFKLLPSGTLHRKSGSKLILGPGMNIDVPLLMKEIEHCKLTPNDLIIDPQAWVVTDDDIDGEEDIRNSVGSTKQGVGQATARRIVNRGGRDTLAVNFSELRPFIGSAVGVLDEAYRKEQRVLLEGTQGTGLSLYHGPYPYVTSRCTTAQGTMAEAGIPPKRIRKVILVVRTNPIRVASPEGGSSGPMAQELTWEEVSERANVPADILRERERTTTTNRLRRIAEFDWVLLQRAVSLNGPTDIALTFVDYIHHTNTKARRFEQLTPETIGFIQELERVATCPVSLITTRFHRRSIIDRRSW